MTTNQDIRPESRITARMLWSLQCPRRYEIEFRNDYRLKGYRPPPWPPSMKSLLHAALRERDKANVRERFLSGPPDPLRGKVAVESVLRVYADQLRKVRGVASYDEVKRSDAEIDKLIEDARRVLSHYDDSEHAPLDFASDGERRPLVDRLAEIQVFDWIYVERVAGVVKREQLPPAVLVRHFTSTVDPVDVARELEMNLGLVGQMWAASQLIGRPVTEALVDVVRTKPPAIPDTVQCRSCRGGGVTKGKVDGETFINAESCSKCGGTGFGGMSKKPCDTTIEIWDATVTERGLDIGEQRERCAETVRKIEERGESFAYRVVVEVPFAAIEAWEQDMVAAADLIPHYKKTGFWPRNPNACAGRTGYCKYRKVCSHHGEEDIAWFTRTVEPYPGLDQR